MSRTTFQPSPLADVACRTEGDRWTLVFVRVLPHTPEKVWAALTDPVQLRAWAPFTADRGPRARRRRDAHDDWRRCLGEFPGVGNPHRSSEPAGVHMGN